MDKGKISLKLLDINNLRLFNFVFKNINSDLFMLKDSFSNSELSEIDVSSQKVKIVNVICPICKSKKDITVPVSIINQTGLTTVSIPKDLVCKHHFQVFIDKQFKVRGYQKVDLDLALNKNKEANIDNFNKNDNELFENLILEGNYLEYKPKKVKNIHMNSEPEKIVSNEEKLMTLKEIYEEFWEFIDDDNSEFKEFIIKDKKRRQGLKSRN